MNGFRAGQFSEWVAAYRKRFLGPGENYDFVLEWKKDVESLEFEDALNAIRDVALDPRDEARFPRQHLRLILEHAKVRRDERERPKSRPEPWGQNPDSIEAWDRRLVELGAISKKEFAKRQAKRKGATA